MLLTCLVNKSTVNLVLIRCIIFVFLVGNCNGENVEDWETFLELPEMDENTNQGRNAIKSRSLKWPNGILPYKLSDKLSDMEKDKITESLKVFGQKTCIKLVPKEEKDKDYVLYDKGKGCGTQVGYLKFKARPHKIVFNDYCLKLTEAIQHETMHVMGIFHEQCRYDRDDYIEIIHKNIQRGQEKNFVKVPKSAADSYDVEYDYNSLMHYGGRAFAKKGANETMKVKRGKPIKKIGHQGHPTKNDILKMNRMYNCKDFL